MAKLAIYELRLIAKNRGINNYLNISREEILSTLNKSERIIENLLAKGLNKIVKIQNLSLNDLEKIERMNNLSLDELNQMAITRNIKNYLNIPRKDLLIALLKSNQDHTELQKSKYNNKEIEETKKTFNELRNNFLKEEIKKIREKFDDREYLNEYFKKHEKRKKIHKTEYQSITKE